MSRKYDREDIWGDKYQEDEEGNRTYERTDIWGDTYREDPDGNRTYDRENIWGEKYREDPDGNREYERTDIWGETYREDDSANRTYRREDVWGDTYEEKEDSSGGCFLTTACVAHAGLPDDCQELSTLRAFRDGYLRNRPNGPELIREYYREAPQIVAVLSGRADSATHLEWVLRQVRDAVDHITRGRFEDAVVVYAAMFRRMRALTLSTEA